MYVVKSFVVPGVRAAAARFFVKGRNIRADRLVFGRGRQRALGSWNAGLKTSGRGSAAADLKTSVAGGPKIGGGRAAAGTSAGGMTEANSATTPWKTGSTAQTKSHYKVRRGRGKAAKKILLHEFSEQTKPFNTLPKKEERVEELGAIEEGEMN